VRFVTDRAVRCEVTIGSTRCYRTSYSSRSSAVSTPSPAATPAPSSARAGSASSASHAPPSASGLPAPRTSSFTSSQRVSPTSPLFTSTSVSPFQFPLTSSVIFLSDFVPELFLLYSLGSLSLIFIYFSFSRGEDARARILRWSCTMWLINTALPLNRAISIRSVCLILD